MPPVVFEQGSSRAVAALRVRIAEGARQGIEVTAFLVEVGDRAVFNDSQAARQSLQELPTVTQRLKRRRIEIAELMQPFELRRRRTRFEQFRMLGAMAQLQQLDDAFD